MLYGVARLVKLHIFYPLQYWSIVISPRHCRTPHLIIALLARDADLSLRLLVALEYHITSAFITRQHLRLAHYTIKAMKLFAYSAITIASLAGNVAAFPHLAMDGLTAPIAADVAYRQLLERQGTTRSQGGAPLPVVPPPSDAASQLINVTGAHAVCLTRGVRGLGFVESFSSRHPAQAMHAANVLASTRWPTTTIFHTTVSPPSMRSRYEAAYVSITSSEYSMFRPT